MSRNNHYTTGDLLDYLHHQSYHKRIGIDLPTQTNTSIPEQPNFKGKLEEDEGAAMFSSEFFFLWKTVKNHSKLFFRFINSNIII